MRRSSLSLALLVGLLIWVLGAPALAAGPEPDYALPGRFLLPWACGEAHKVTWTPADHWANGKTVGVAFDFSMSEGTPLHAPASGVARFLGDERSSASNLGNFLEIVVEGDWLIRLAHLRDEQSGERPVRAGELLAYSGSSGASAAHLHLELLVRDEKGWGRPDMARLERFFGLPMSDLVEGATLANDGCPARLALAGAVQPTREELPLGEAVELAVPLRNDGLEPLTLSAVQLALQDPIGQEQMAVAQGPWVIEGQALLSIPIGVHPDSPGTWKVQQVTCEVEGASQSFAAEGAFTDDFVPKITVSPSALKLVGITGREGFDVGQRIALEAWVENTSDADLAVDDLHLEGLQPDGAPWRASAGRAALIHRRSVSRFLLYSPTVPTRVGKWQMTRLGYEHEKQILYFARLERSFDVWGPELRVDRVALYASPKGLDTFLLLTNVGTRPAVLDALVAWGWEPDGEQQFSMKNSTLRELLPGRSALIRLTTPLELAEGTYRLAEVGYWTRGEYYRLALPEEPAVLVAPAISAEARSSS